jgi:hypothetical protein
MTHDGPNNTVLPSRCEWAGSGPVRVVDEDGDVWFASIVRAWVTKRTRRLTRVVLVSGGGTQRTGTHRRRVLRTERVTDGDLAGLRVLHLGGAW